jgi:beta-galactosidase
MAELGLSHVRIGEFAWSRLEPQRGAFDFDWLARAIDTLHQAGMKIVLGTPTATPPKWLVDEMPDMLPVDRKGNTRTFGSRRHYSFSHQDYRRECARIVTALARRFGEHPAVTAWQTDNEYDCHDTTLSFSTVDLAAFRQWLAHKYQSPDALNRAWGNVFWSMEIADFDEIELPGKTVTEANPAHWMDFHRFASDQVVQFNKLQCDIIRKYSPGRDVIHNFMGRTLAFDHFQVGADLDVSSWDSYPLGFLEDRSDDSEDFKKRFAHAGDPDFQAFHHDLYRGTSKGRWWIMEQQPGPVNWAPHNPAPRKGMVRLWTLEAFAHGAEVVSYFRWRQVPFAQEQMHSGILRPDASPAEAWDEISATLGDMAKLPQPTDSTGRASVAIIFDYPSAWAWNIQPQGREFNYFRLVHDFYKGLRRLGLSVDFVPAGASDLSPYQLVLIPGLFTFPNSLVEALGSFSGTVLAGPRSGSKTDDFRIPDSLPPGLPANLLDARINRVESLRADCPVAIPGGNFRFWREFAAAGKGASIAMMSGDGEVAMIRQNGFHYLCGWPDAPAMDHVLAKICKFAEIDTPTGGEVLPEGLRLRSDGGLMYAVNYSDQIHDLSGFNLGELILGEAQIPPSGVAVFRMGK